MKNKNLFLKKALASFAVSGLLLSGLVVGGTIALDSNESNPLVTDASAGVAGGGSGGGGSGGGSGLTGRWLKIPKAKLDNGSIRNIPSVYKKSDVCKNAEAYYGVVPKGVSTTNATSGGWGYSFNAAINVNGADYTGGADMVEKIAKNTGWSNAKARKYMFEKNFICLDNPNVITKTEWRYEVRTSGSSTASLNENQIHSITSQVVPQAINTGTDKKPVMKVDPIGANNLNSQASIKKTNYGKVWDDYNKAVSKSNSNKEDIVKKFKQRFADAKKADKKAEHASVNLNSGNRAGLAEGGILNVTEFTRKTRAAASTKTTDYQVWRCGFVQYSKTGWQASSSNNCEKVKGSMDPNNLPKAGMNSAKWKNNSEEKEYKPTKAKQSSWKAFSTTVKPSTETQQHLGFWQIISVHCNEQELAALKTALGSNLTALDSGDSSKSISGLYRTKFYSSRPSTLPLGDRNASNAAQKATSKLGFYDKECPFDCTPNRSGDGASSDNGASGNIAQDNFSKTAKGLFGVKLSDGVNSNYSEIFRDNEERTIRPDVWYPISTKGVNYKGEEAKSTLITRWAGGTPSLGNEFNIYAMIPSRVPVYDPASKTESEKKHFYKGLIFDPEKKTQPEQKNFDKASSYKSSTASQITGQVKELVVKSTWASDSGKPQVVQMAWEYSPTVSSKVPSTLGFGSGGGSVKLGSMISRNTEIDGRCWGNYGTTKQSASDKALTKKELQSGTGTGTTPKFGVPDSSEKTSRNIVFNFVRGTSE